MYLTSIWAHFNLIIYILTIIYQAIIITSGLQISHMHLKHKSMPKLHKYLRQWKYHLARLNDIIDIYFKENYKVVDYHIKKPNMRLKDLTRVPFGYYKWRRRHHARLQCIQHVRLMTANPPRIIYAYQSTNQHKDRLRFDTDSYTILVDNCCSRSITNSLKDYIDPPTDTTTKIKGYNGVSTKPTKVGTVQWSWEDDTGQSHTFHIKDTYYSPDAETRLLSPQHWASALGKGRDTHCMTYHDAIILTWGQNKKTIPISYQTSHVGILTTTPGTQRYNRKCNNTDKLFPILAYPATIDLDFTDTYDSTSDDLPTKATKHKHKHTQQDNASLDRKEHQGPIRVTFNEPEQKENNPEQPTYSDERQEYMKWHYKLNHATQNTMTRMAQQRMLPPFITKILNKLEKTGGKPPMCNDCYCANACRKPWRNKPKKENKHNTKKPLSPGDVVSVDQLESAVPGFIGQITGSLTRKRIIGATVYVDQASDLSYVHCHTSMSSEETVRGKEAFEQYAKTHGVYIKHYHADNGRFKDKAFMKSIEKNNQTISFSGVGAHHQNGIAEKRIGDLQRKATTLLLHAQRRWPNAINTHLWAYALKAANDSRNAQPNKVNAACPISRFCQTGRVPSLKNQHHFGCPVYVLKKEIQDGKKAKKWTDRTRVGINLGYSSRHAQSVTLVLNLETGLVSPQFHCHHDDMFETTTGVQSRSIPRSKWQTKAGLGPLEDQEAIEQTSQDEQVHISEDENSQSDQEQQEMGEDIEDNNDEVYQTRSGRKVRKPERLNYVAYEAIMEPYDYEQEDMWIEQDLLAYKASTDPDTMYYHQAMREPDKEKFKEAIMKECEDHFRESNYKLVEIKDVPKDAPLLSSVWQMKRKRKPSTGEISKYKARMNVNGKEQVKGVHYDETYAPVVGWSTIRFFMSLAMLNKWHTRQLDFLLAYTQADIERDLYMKIPAGFVISGKALSEEERKKYALKLEKNLYGQKQAGRVWYLHLKKNLEKIGFKASKHDECLFYYGKTIFIVYTDDTILMGPDQKEVDNLVKKIGSIFKIEDQGDLSDYLGMKITAHRDGSMEWTQPNLIKSILKDLGLIDQKSQNAPTSRKTPAHSTVTLTSHEEDTDHDQSKFNYRQVIGKLLYLEKSTRPDISCAVHQCARFSANPKAKHAEAVKRIGRYLLGSQEKGLIMKPNSDGLECWVDASHASEWSNKSAENDSDTARSRMGYLITYAGFPMHWASKMQTEIALSSTEAEYIALSQAMREVIPIMWLLNEAKDMGIPVMNQQPKVMCKVFEDNAGAIEIANVPKMRPRTKHLNIKYHHFREEVKKGNISVYHVGTKEQVADIFTKALDESLFTKFRERIQGW